jgi:hypothetical protein
MELEHAAGLAIEDDGHPAADVAGDNAHESGQR